MPQSASPDTSVRAIPPSPPIVYLEPTNACNCNCIICPRRHMTRGVGYMDLALLRRIVDQLAAAGGADVRLFNFGEPLLHPDLPDMVSYCRARGLTGRIQTNGILLTDVLGDRLLEAGLDYLGVSVNGLTPEEYGVLRPGFTFGDVRDKVRRFKRAAVARRQPVHVHVNAHMVGEDRERRREDLARFAREWTDTADSLSVSGISRYADIAYLAAGTVCRGGRAADARKPDRAVACTEPFDRLVIKWDGRATPCCADFDAACVVGDLRSGSLLDAWRSPAMLALRESVASRSYSTHPLCRECPKLYSDEFHMVLQKR